MIYFSETKAIAEHAKIDYKAQGKANRAAGARFELKVRKDLEDDGWIVDKFTNNVDLESSCFIKAKSNKFRLSSTGFPDFVAIKKGCGDYNNLYNVKLVECKVNGTLSKTEKLKMEWLHGEGFECWVASKSGASVEYKRPGLVRRENPKDKA